MKSRLSSLFAACGLLCGQASAGPPGPLHTFLDRHCIECHDADLRKGGLDLAALKFNLADASTFRQWQRIFERVRDGEMPPAKKPRPDPADARRFLSELNQPLLKADAADVVANGRVRSRRLTRTEYEHTLHDLLGIDIPLKDLLPEDRASHGFETVADGQQLSHHQLGRYLDVADRALEDAFGRALEGEPTFRKHCAPEDLAMFTNNNYRGPDLRDGKSLSWPIGLQFFGRMKATEVPADGWYRVTLRGVHAINPGGDGAVWGTLRSGACASNAPMLFLVGLVEATRTPRDLVYQAWIQKDHMLELKPNDGTLKRAPTGAKGGNVSFAGRDLEKDGFAGIAHRGIDLERIHPVADGATVRRNLFGDVNPTEPNLDHAAALDRLVTRFATRAFRRPVSGDQIARYRAMGRSVLAEGEPLTEALRTVYRAILCSPRFLTFVETPGELDGHAIASRLSYALWVSMPDAPLLNLAAEGQLRRPDVLARQVDRMLADPKAKRFIASFTDQWLKLKEIDFTSPDTRQFPTFDPVVQESMLQETRAYFAELVKSDLGIVHLVDSDFAFLNGRLARHYGGEDRARGQSDQWTGRPSDKDRKSRQGNDSAESSPLPASLTHGLMVSDFRPGAGLQKVSLDSKAPRGGLVTQGAVLKVTADGTATSPVVRGVFVNERILGERIPPPPPGIPAIEPDTRGATSIRDQLAKHRSNESCAACHKTIDPPGFALESFDPVGGLRTRYGKDESGAKVDPSGVTPEGDPFADLAAWKQIYAKRGTQLAEGFARQFLTYATGAPMRFSDHATITQIAAHTEKNGHGVRSIIREAVLSEMFLRK